MKATLAALAIVSALAPSLAAADDKYVDNRSDAASLVKSLYNAVNRKEYARAWDYFGDQKPAKSYEKFVDGYSTTDRVDVATGAVSEEGAAGSIYYQVPVAIRATDTDGNARTFAGCYTARLLQPANQEPPFRPMHIEKGQLKPASQDGPLSNALPQGCGDAPPQKAEDETTDKVVAAFKASFAGDCETLAADAEPDAAEPQIYTLKYKLKYDAEGDPAHEAKLYQFLCGAGAYNSNEVYYVAGEDGFSQLHFAEPELQIEYDDPDEETKLKSMAIIGYRASDRLVNSEYDEDAQELTSFSKWRGIGDASSSGKWIFRDGEFTLVHYEVDPTTNGEEDPQTVLDLQSAP